MLWFFFFVREACGILAPPQEIKPVPPALEGEVVTTGSPGKSLNIPDHSLIRKVWEVRCESAFQSAAHI